MIQFPVFLLSVFRTFLIRFLLLCTPPDTVLEPSFAWHFLFSEVSWSFHKFTGSLISARKIQLQKTRMFETQKCLVSSMQQKKKFFKHKLLDMMCTRIDTRFFSFFYFFAFRILMNTDLCSFPLNEEYVFYRETTDVRLPVLFIG